MPAPTFQLLRFNPRRAARGAEAAEYLVTWEDGSTDQLWMSERDIRANLREFGESEDLRAGLDSYKKGTELQRPTARP